MAPPLPAQVAPLPEPAAAAAVAFGPAPAAALPEPPAGLSTCAPLPSAAPPSNRPAIRCTLPCGAPGCMDGAAPSAERVGLPPSAAGVPGREAKAAAGSPPGSALRCSGADVGCIDEDDSFDDIAASRP